MTPEEFSRARRTLSGRLAYVLQRLFLGLGSWRDADRDVFVQQAVPLVRGGQRAMADMVAAYIAQQASAQLRRPVVPPRIPDGDAVNLRLGVDDTEVYARPFADLYDALSGGKTLTESVERGKARLLGIAELDMQQAYAHSSRAALRNLDERDRPSAWRRVLVGAENCAMCVVASTQRYHIERLNPIHNGCDCRVEPLWGKPVQVIDPDLLEQVHAAVQQLTGVADRGGRAPDYRQITIAMTKEHGEVGPMLARPRDKFTGPDDIPGRS